MANILIVDDSQTFREQLRKDLESRNNVVIEAGDGIEGLEVLKTSGLVDLILCDVNMPNMDGMTMCSMVRQQDQYKNIPIFMLTTEANAQMRIKAKEIGVRAWLTKPYLPETLFAAVDRVIKR